MGNSGLAPPVFFHTNHTPHVFCFLKQPLKTTRQKTIMHFTDQIRAITQNYQGVFQFEIQHTPDIFQLLNDLTLSSEIPIHFQIKLYAAMGYFVAPYDIYPEETFGAIGYIDDLLFALVVIKEISQEVGLEPLYDNWPGEIESLQMLLANSIENIKESHPKFYRQIQQILSYQQPL